MLKCPSSAIAWSLVNRDVSLLICPQFVCPRGVLKLENGKEEGRINDKPITIGNNSITVHL
jgi:hypothetical protein